MKNSRYASLGVDVHKTGIGVFKKMVSGVYRHAFCDIHPVPGRPSRCYSHHSDGAGSKSVQNYLNWKETRDIRAFEGIAQDTLAMNIGDTFATGLPEWNSFIDYIAMNKFVTPKVEVLEILFNEWVSLIRMLNERYGIKIALCGGETADLPDQTRTIDVCGSIYSEYKWKNVITGRMSVLKIP